MAGRIERGGVWLHRFAAADKRRRVVIISRQDVIDLISTVMVAPITSTIRGLPSEVPLDANLRPARMAEICRALSVAAGCS